MNLKGYLHSKFGSDLFSHLKKDDILKERISVEKNIEKISDEITDIQDKIQGLMLESKGQAKPMKLLNIQKIKALRLESNTKQQEANELIKQLQLLLLLEAMREHQELDHRNEFLEKVMNSDVDHLNDTLFNAEVKKAIEEGKMEDVKNKLKHNFAQDDLPADAETNELLTVIEDLENVDEETALKMAGTKAREIAESPPVKKRVVE
ncbi:MAG: hypothetical protein ABIH52_04715 [Candidatus Aenigmatarchaeota archaeon]|nr:hypothetical protein [Nanoarchaeota archaeon]